MLLVLRCGMIGHRAGSETSKGMATTEDKRAKLVNCSGRGLVNAVAGSSSELGRWDRTC